MSNLHALLKAMVDRGASDLHLTVGAPPKLRVDGKLLPMHHPDLTAAETKQLTYSVLTEAQRHKFEEENELDWSFGLKGVARFRANVFLQRGELSAVFRRIPQTIPTLDELGIPVVVRGLVEKSRGLVLVCGPTGSGKSTTLASLIDRINTMVEGHIVTVEDPIEFLHVHKKCSVNQREVGSDTKSFQVALRHMLRQDPDVVLIGEMRDHETMEAALTIAETGHLCFATLHSDTAVQSINRILDVFPPNQQPQIRAQLAIVLEAVVCQRLVPRAGKPGRVLACEVMLPNSAIRALIRDNKIEQIYSAMQSGQAHHHMQTLNQHLASLVSSKTVSREDALGFCSDRTELERLLSNHRP